MKVRLASFEEDRDQILAGVADFVRRMDYTEFLDEDISVLEASLRTLATANLVDVVVAEHEGEIVAGIGIAYIPFIWNPNVLQADELFWWADGSMVTAPIRVLRMAIDLGKERAGDRKMIATFRRLSSSPEGVTTIYRKLGLREVESVYAGVL